MTRVTILGSALQISGNIDVVTVQISAIPDRPIAEINGMEWWYMQIAFQIGITKFTPPSFVFTRGSDRFGNDGLIRKNLFEKIHKERKIPEEIRASLANFILDEFKKGEVKEKDIMNKLHKIIETE